MHNIDDPDVLLAELDKVHEHIKAFREYKQPLPQALLDKLREIRVDAQAGMNAEEG